MRKILFFFTISAVLAFTSTTHSGYYYAVGGGVALVWDEQYEDTGTGQSCTGTTDGVDEAWTYCDDDSGANTLDSNKTAVHIAAPASWLLDCCEMIASSGDAYYRITGIGGTTKLWWHGEYIVDADGPADNGESILIAGMTDSSANLCWYLYVGRTASEGLCLRMLWYDGASNQNDYSSIAIDTLYEVDVKYDLDGDVFQWWVNDVAQYAGEQTNNSTRTVDRYYDGIQANTTGDSLTLLSDLWQVSTEGYID